MNRFLTVLLISCFAGTLQLNAQNWEIGVLAGGAGYIGDLNPINPVKISGVNGGFFVKRKIDEYFSAGFHYNFGQIKADDARSSDQQFRDRNLNFKTNLNEASLLLQFNFLEYFKGSRRRFLNPYLFAGAGMVFFKPTTIYNGNKIDLSSYDTEGVAYKNFVITVPFGAGVRYNWKEQISIFSQVGYRQPFTDYIDDVSGNYPDPAVFQNSPDPVTSLALADRSGERTGIYIGSPGTQRGDYRKRDTYMFVGIGISYTFVSSKCY